MNIQRSRLHLSLAVLLVACVAATTWMTPAQAEPGRAKYVFLMIGDGMGAPQRAATEFYLQSLVTEDPGKPGIQKLLMNQFPAQGMTSTFAQNAIITDSAAAGTAIACGQKTASGVVCMDANRTKSFPTIAELAKKQGMKVGIVSSVSIDHATPACFYAHAPSRSDYYGLAVQLAKSDFDYFGGGAARGAMPDKLDGRDSPVEIARRNGFEIAQTREELAALQPGNRVWTFNHTCDSSAALFYEIDRPEDHISLAEFTRKGIELLNNPDGFFMMVEGGKIDWACHANDAATAIADTIAFDEAIAEAFEFYREHPEETLIVVTGDHECGGMSIGFAGTRYGSFPRKIAKQQMSYLKFNEQVGQFRKSGTSFEDALPVIRETFGFEELSIEEMEHLRAAYRSSMEGKETRANDKKTYLLYGGYEPLAVACTQILNHQAGIAWTTYSHTGVPVQTSAIGVGHELFNGYYDNTDIFAKLAEAMALPGVVAGQAAAAR